MFKNKVFIKYFLALGIFLIPFFSHAASIKINPQKILQGDPIMITVSDLNNTTISSGYVGTTKLYFFKYKNNQTALYGVGINQKVGTTTVTISLSNGTQASTSFLVAPRIHPEEFMAIPAQLGGNSTNNQARIVSILSKENEEIASIYSRKDKTLLSQDIVQGIANAFTFPVASTTLSPLTVTNEYGYNRESGAETITHKGVDFRAIPGTPVYAIQRGVVRAAKAYTVYGNSIIIDHGLGLLSMYMHLSKINVLNGSLVEKGQLIGYSGETGYSEGPHLHLSVRTNGESIDPIKFFNLFGMHL